MVPTETRVEMNKTVGQDVDRTHLSYYHPHSLEKCGPTHTHVYTHTQVTLVRVHVVTKSSNKRTSFREKYTPHGKILRDVSLMVNVCKSGRRFTILTKSS